MRGANDDEGWPPSSGEFRGRPLARQLSIFAWGGDMPSTPEGILARYLHLRQISNVAETQKSPHLAGMARHPE